MIKNTTHRRSHTGHIRARLVVLVLALSSTTALAQFAETNTLISLTKTHNTHPGELAIVDVNLTRSGSGPAFGGFDFLMEYDNQALTLVGVYQGALLDSAGWEYFSYHTEGVAPGTVAVRVIAVADLANNGEQPSSYLAGQSGQLAQIQFLASTDPVYDCQFLPLRFYWNDCGDNAVSSVAGDTLYVVEDVSNFYDWTPVERPTVLPSTDGLPDYCVAGMIGGTPPSRELSIWHGGVDIACTDTIDDRGDLNLNSIPYEIADYVVYFNYLVHGLSALDSNPQFRQAQIATSDVNADGINLTFRDMVYLVRVIIGDALPIPKGRPQTATAAFTQNTTSNSLRVDYPGYLAGARLVFSGEITPALTIPAIHHEFVFDGTHTRFVIAPNEPNSYGSGIWFTYTGTGTLDSVETADWFDSDVPAQIFVSAGPGACGDPNADQKTNISDIVFLIRYIFDEGAAPFDVNNGDVDCDGLATISDAVYLIAYVFAGGPAPCANCP